MVSINIQLVCTILAEILFVILPLITTFHKEWRFSATKITGILAEYLFFVCLFTFASLCFSRDQIYPPWICITTTADILLCRWFSKADWQVVVYTLLLFKSFADITVLCASPIYAFRNLPKGNLHIANTELAYCLLLLFATVSSAHYLPHCYLLEAADYMCPLPVRKHLVSIPVLFFTVYHFDTGNVPAQLLLARYPNTAFPVMGWVVCTYTVYYVALRILSKLAQSYAIKEQYRTTRPPASVRTSQTVVLQYNLDQLKKVRHDYCHYPITLKGPLEEEKADQTLEYINEYLGSFEVLSMVQYCSNAFSSALLNYYIKPAQDQRIDVETSISLPPSLPVPEIDFYTILGNLLSSAVESCTRRTCGPASIAINIGQAGKSMIALSVRNTYTHVICLRDGRFMSSKRDDPGTGISSVRYLMDRYHGIPKSTHEEGIFEAPLFLNPFMK